MAFVHGAEVLSEGVVEGAEEGAKETAKGIGSALKQMGIGSPIFGLVLALLAGAGAMGFMAVRKEERKWKEQEITDANLLYKDQRAEETDQFGQVWKKRTKNKNSISKSYGYFFRCFFQSY